MNILYSRGKMPNIQNEFPPHPDKDGTRVNMSKWNNAQC